MSTYTTISTHVLDTALGAPAAGIAVSLARVGSNGFRLHWRAACKMGSHGFGKTPDVLLILTFASRGRTLSCNAALLFIAEAFLLRPFERPGLDEDSLAHHISAVSG